MKDRLRALAERLIPPRILGNWIARRREKQLQAWMRAGRPAPPPQHLKQQVVANYQRSTGCQVLIETGTYLGDMVEAQKRNFGRIISIELSEPLYKKAAYRFRNEHHVSIVHGDSGKVLPEILAEIRQPVLFWLDGHYSGDITACGETVCPLMEELRSILSLPGRPAILIDDARLMTGGNGYPTMAEVKAFVNLHAPWLEITVEDDIVRCIPRNGA